MNTEEIKRVRVDNCVPDTVYVSFIDHAGMYEMYTLTEEMARSLADKLAESGIHAAHPAVRLQRVLDKHEEWVASQPPIPTENQETNPVGTDEDQPEVSEAPNCVSALIKFGETQAVRTDDEYLFRGLDESISILQNHINIMKGASACLRLDPDNDTECNAARNLMEGSLNSIVREARVLRNHAKDNLS